MCQRKKMVGKGQWWDHLYDGSAPEYFEKNKLYQQFNTPFFKYFSVQRILRFGATR